MAFANIKLFYKKRRLIILLSAVCMTLNSHAQIDSLAKSIADTLKSKLIVDDIPRNTFFDKLMYPHRWYVKQLLAPKNPDFDTSYIKTIKHKLTITVPVSKKFFGININDLNTNKSLKFSPNNYYHVGFNFSNIIVTFGFAPGIKFGAQPNKGNTVSKDLQVTAIGRKVITDINLQNYKGFYLYNSKEFDLQSTNPDTFVVRPDIKVFSFGINTMYVFNTKKYSLRGAFSFTDVQRKSAGSFMAGVFHSHLEFRSPDSAFVQTLNKSNFSETVNNLNKVTVITLGLSGGYGYTFVYKKFIYSNCINLGIGGQRTNYELTNQTGHTLSFNPVLNFNAKSALRYDNLRFFIGIMATYDNKHTLNPSGFKTDNYVGKVLGFVGYRFNIKQNGRKVLKALTLIDYKK